MIWIKENGNEITLNDEKATVMYAESLGWKKKAAPKKKRVKKPVTE